MTNTIGRRLHRLERLETAVGPEGDPDFAAALAAALVRARNDPEGVRHDRRAWVAACEARLAAGEALSPLATELLEAHRRRERFGQIRKQS